ncbi:MAG: exodeoxyribonuclease VII small subunit [Syntrophotaleaceae bacterium]
MNKDSTFEKDLRSLETVVEQLESGELSLEEALSCFEEGVRCAARCQEQLKAVETKIEVLLKQHNGSLVVENFRE